MIPPADANVLDLWTIYRAPADFPGVPFIVRRWTVLQGGGLDPAIVAMPAQSLLAARALIPEGLHRLERSPTEDPVVVETWL